MVVHPSSSLEDSVETGRRGRIVPVQEVRGGRRVLGSNLTIPFNLGTLYIVDWKDGLRLVTFSHVSGCKILYIYSSSSRGRERRIDVTKERVSAGYMVKGCEEGLQKLRESSDIHI